MEYLVIILVNLLVYYRSLKYGICVDDIKNRKSKWGNINIWRRIRFALNGQKPIKNITLDHFLTLFIHTLTCVLMQVAFNCLPATLLFAVHVGNTQVSVWMNGKRYGVVACLCLASYILAPLGAIGLLLVPFFQPSGLLFPIVLMLKGFWYLFPIMLLFPFVGKKFIFKWARSRAKQCSNEWFKKISYKKIPYVLKTYTFYFFRAIVPMSPCMYISYMKKAGLTKEANYEACKFDKEALFGLLLIMLIPFLYIKFPSIFFGAMWWLILISTWNNFITYTVPYAERYMYLPNIGLLVTLTILLDFVHPSLWMILFGIHLGRLISYLPMYENLVEFLFHHTRIDPENDISWNFLCNISSEANNAIATLYLADTGLSYNKKSKMLWLHKASVLHALNHQEKALECIRKSREYLEEVHTKEFKNQINNIENKILTKIKENKNGCK